MLKRSCVSFVRGILLNSIVCVVGNSRVQVHWSRFSQSHVRPLAVFDLPHLLLNGSIVSNNSVHGFSGGIRLEGRANVTITGGSRVQGNNATQDGGGLVARGNAVLTVDGNSSLSGNSAGQFGGGLVAFGNVNITFTGASIVNDNVARNRSGGGLALWDTVKCVLMVGSRVHGNSAARSGGGLVANNSTHISVLGCSIDHNNADNGGGIADWQSARVVLDRNSSVHNNTAGDAGGGIFVQGKFGGGVSAGDNVTITLTGSSSVHSNTAGDAGGGGGVFVQGYVT